MKSLLRLLILALLVFAGLSAFSTDKATVFAGVVGPGVPNPCGGGKPGLAPAVCRH